MISYVAVPITFPLCLPNCGVVSPGHATSLNSIIIIICIVISFQPLPFLHHCKAGSACSSVFLSRANPRSVLLGPDTALISKRNPAWKIALLYDTNLRTVLFRI